MTVDKIELIQMKIGIDEGRTVTREMVVARLARLGQTPDEWLAEDAWYQLDAAISDAEEQSSVPDPYEDPLGFLQYLRMTTPADVVSDVVEAEWERLREAIRRRRADGLDTFGL